MGAKWVAALPINGTEEEVDTLREAMLKQRATERVTVNVTRISVCWRWCWCLHSGHRAPGMRRKVQERSVSIIRVAQQPLRRLANNKFYLLLLAERGDDQLA